MIKVNYDINGKILGFYPDNISYNSIPTPFIEITEEQHKEILDNQNIYRIVNGELKDISNEPEFALEQTIRQNNSQIANYKQEIIQIEAAQHRTIRELLLYDTEEAKNRLAEQENRIIEIRTKMQEIQL